MGPKTPNPSTLQRARCLAVSSRRRRLHYSSLSLFSLSLSLSPLISLISLLYLSHAHAQDRASRCPRASRADLQSRAGEPPRCPASVRAREHPAASSTPAASRPAPCPVPLPPCRPCPRAERPSARPGALRAAPEAPLPSSTPAPALHARRPPRATPTPRHRAPEPTRCRVSRVRAASLPHTLWNRSPIVYGASVSRVMELDFVRFSSPLYSPSEERH